MGLGRGLFSEKREREYSDRELLTRYAWRIGPFKKSVTLISLFILISTVADIIIPLFVGFAVDELEKPDREFSLILGAGVVYLVLSATIWIMFSLRRREVGNFMPYFLENLRMDIFDKLLEQDMSFYDRYLSGSLNSRVANDALDFGNTTILLADTMGNFLVSILTFTILFWLNPTLALITLAGAPFLFVLMFSLRKLARAVSRAYRKSIGNINNAMVESIEGIQVCKSYGQEGTVSEQ
ncbi:MAG: ABC transporter transmembrane domain-containing protein, partial [Candidatus Thorarchaeota archaeon]